MTLYPQKITFGELRASASAMQTQPADSAQSTVARRT